MKRAFAIVFATLALGLCACEKDDLGASCPDPMGTTGSTDVNGSDTEAIFPATVRRDGACESFRCVSTQVRRNYCSKECTSARDCPDGFACEILLPVGPPEVAGVRFCLLAKSCRQNVANDCPRDRFVCREVATSVPLLLLVLWACAPAPPKAEAQQPTPTVTLTARDGDPIKVAVEIVDTPDGRAQGMMYRQKLADGAGMLFLFPREARQSFWMKNTLIPLDMIFIAADLSVAGVVANAEPMTLTPRGVDAPSQFVLEVNTGFAAHYGIAKGSRVRFDDVPKPPKF